MIEKISFVIISWNSEKTIEMCLTSIEKKCREENIEYEVLIVDNGSQDSTTEIIDKKSVDMSIDLTRLQKNRGTTYTRNLALKKFQTQ